MILGVGVDIVEVKRIKRIVETWGEKFLNRIFTPGELEYSFSKKNKFIHLAARFAAKEATLKAFKLTPRIPWQEIEVVNSPRGAPEIKLSPSFEYLLRDKTLVCSLSHTQNYAIAQVILAQER
jgi:holo-[acyl-carrier protein] synthase